jgi:hypothetical protein
MISLMNSTALATAMEAAGFALMHFVNLSTATKICVNPPLAFLNGPTRSNPNVGKGQVIGMAGVDETTHISGEQRTGTFHNDKPGSQRQIW